MLNLQMKLIKMKTMMKNKEQSSGLCKVLLTLLLSSAFCSMSAQTLGNSGVVGGWTNIPFHARDFYRFQDDYIMIDMSLYQGGDAGLYFKYGMPYFNFFEHKGNIKKMDVRIYENKYMDEKKHFELNYDKWGRLLGAPNLDYHSIARLKQNIKTFRNDNGQIIAVEYGQSIANRGLMPFRIDYEVDSRNRVLEATVHNDKNSQYDRPEIISYKYLDDSNYIQSILRYRNGDMIGRADIEYTKEGRVKLVTCSNFQVHSSLSSYEGRTRGFFKEYQYDQDGNISKIVLYDIDDMLKEMCVKELIFQNTYDSQKHLVTSYYKVRVNYYKPNTSAEIVQGKPEYWNGYWFPRNNKPVDHEGASYKRTFKNDKYGNWIEMNDGKYTVKRVIEY